MIDPRYKPDAKVEELWQKEELTAQQSKEKEYRLEKDLEDAFVLGVRRLGGMTEKIGGQARWGVPDRLVLFPGGRILLVELKRKGGDDRSSQSLWHSKAAARGVTVSMVRNRQELNRWLNYWKRSLVEEGLIG